MNMTTNTLSSLFGGTAMLAVLTVGGCSDGDSEETGEVTATISVELPDFSIPVGESFQCYYSDVITEKDLSVVSAGGKQVEGGHHLSLYYVDNERPVGLQECSGTTEMVDWHFVVGAGGEGNEDAQLSLPKGLAFKVPKGKQLMVQAHYINVSGAEMPAADSMTIELTEAEKVEAYAADFVIDDDHFEIEPHSDFTSVMTCEVPQDLSLTMLLGHMHEQGAYYKLEQVDEAGELLTVLYESEWIPSFASPPPINKYGTDQPLELEKGPRLRQTCQWKNETDAKLLFPTEMCIGFGYYFPGTERVMCERMEEPK